MVFIPEFPEAKHQIVVSLADLTDRDLIARCQHQRDRGQFFTGLFCRYAEIVYTQVRPTVASPSVADYLFAIVWREIFQEIEKLDIPPPGERVDWQGVDCGHYQ
jgi:hypothetical protein